MSNTCLTTRGHVNRDILDTSSLILKIKPSYSLRKNQLTQRWLSRLRDFRILAWWLQRQPIVGKRTQPSGPMALEKAHQPMSVNNSRESGLHTPTSQPIRCQKAPEAHQWKITARHKLGAHCTRTLSGECARRVVSAGSSNTVDN